MFVPLSLLILGCQVHLVSGLSVRGSHSTARRVDKRDVFEAFRKAQSFSFLSTEQAPPIPAYVDYSKSDEPEFTTFNNVSNACRACIEFWPEKEDGKRWRSPLYKDPDGGVWERSCRAGKCDFRDPQTDPVGGIIGKGQGPGGKPDGKTCITRDPVQWYQDCDPVLKEDASNMLDVTRYCSYREQMFIPPPEGTVSRFAGNPEAWTRIGGTSEKCLHTIEREGSALWDSMSFCDANVPLLSGCCETVYQSLKCVAEGHTKLGGTSDTIFAAFGENSSAAQMLDSFANYCIPLCENTQDEFCEKFPKADVCVKPEECVDCTQRGGLWCPKLKTCHCPSKNPPCIKPPVTIPATCPNGDGPSWARGAGDGAAAKAGPGIAGPKPDAVCKYAEMARTWRRRTAVKDEE